VLRPTAIAGLVFEKNPLRELAHISPHAVKLKKSQPATE
jgi:hypothetical protein